MGTENNKATTRKMSRGQIIIAVVAVVILVGIGWYNRQPTATGLPFLVTVEGTQLVPGQTTVQELLDAGFVVGDSELSAGLERVFTEFDTTKKLDKQSYISNVYLNKAGETAARVELANFSPNGGKPLAECVVTKVNVAPRDAEKFKIVIGETPFSDFTPDTIATIYPQAEAGTDATVVVDKNYQLRFEMENGEIGYISSVYDKSKK